MTFFKYGCGTPAGKLNGGPVTHDYRSGEKQMLDHNGRKIDYLRISVTDRCNLRCRYCMPDGICSVPMSQILTYEEIRTVAEAAAELGELLRALCVQWHTGFLLYFQNFF